MIAHKQLCAILNVQVTSCVFDRLDCLSRSIGYLKGDRCLESAELFASLAEKLDAFGDFAEHTGIDQGFHGDRCLRIQMTFLNMVSQLAEIELL